MGKYSSSTYRVCPLMKGLEDATFSLDDLLNLVRIDSNPSIFPSFNKIVPPIRYADKETGRSEIPLHPPKDFLIAMIDKAVYMGKRKDDFNVQEAKDTIKTMYANMEANRSAPNLMISLPKHQHILEGNSYPDFFIQTDSFILVGEGKWTESETTTKTKFLKHRNQMVRHIQGAIEYARLRELDLPVYGIYLVSANFLNNKKNRYIMTSIDFKKEAIDKEEIKIHDEQVIMEAYKGYVTWETISRELRFEFYTVEEIELSKTTFIF